MSKAQSKVNKELYNLMSEVNQQCQQLKFPVPKSLNLQPIGHTLTEFEWAKFKKRCLLPKMAKCTVRKLDGNIQFFGEYGLEAAHMLQKKFSNTHFLMHCDNEKCAIVGLYLASKLGLDIAEVQYKNDILGMVNVNDKQIMQQLMSKVNSIQI